MLEAAVGMGEPGRREDQQHREQARHRPAETAVGRAGEAPGGGGQGQGERGPRDARGGVLRPREETQRARPQRLDEQRRLEGEEQKLPHGEGEGADLQQAQGADAEPRGHVAHDQQSPDHAAEGEAQAHEDGAAEEAVEEAGQDQHARLRPTGVSGPTPPRASGADGAGRRRRGGSGRGAPPAT